MCYDASTYRTLSSLVAWLNVVCSILGVIYYAYLLATLEQKREETRDSEISRKTDYLLLMENNVNINYVLLVKLAGAVLLGLVPSILLVKGIEQNRRKLVAPWLYIAYVSVVFNCLELIFMIWGSTAFTGTLGIDLKTCLPSSVGLMFSMLCIYPVWKLYRILLSEPENYQHNMPIDKY